MRLPSSAGCFGVSLKCDDVNEAKAFSVTRAMRTDVALDLDAGRADLVGVLPLAA